jgi:hypothetical protein
MFTHGHAHGADLASGFVSSMLCSSMIEIQIKNYSYTAGQAADAQTVGLSGRLL